MTPHTTAASSSVPLALPTRCTQRPAEEFYWAVLDTSRLPANRWRRNDPATSLGYLFESHLPVPIDGVQAVYRAVAPARILACGMDMDRLDLLTKSPNTLTLTPADIPAELGVSADAGSLNLLTGDFLPPPLCRLERARSFSLVVAVLLVFTVLFIGIGRRRATARERESLAREQIESLYRTVLPPANSASTQPDSLRLIAELRQLRLTRQTPNTGAQSPDAAATLAALLQALRASGTESRVDSISVGPDAASIRAVVSSPEHAARLHGGLDSLPGFDRAMTQVTAMRDAIRVELRYVRTGEPPP